MEMIFPLLTSFLPTPAEIKEKSHTRSLLILPHLI